MHRPLPCTLLCARALGMLIGVRDACIDMPCPCPILVSQAVEPGCKTYAEDRIRHLLRMASYNEANPRYPNAPQRHLMLVDEIELATQVNGHSVGSVSNAVTGILSPVTADSRPSRRLSSVPGIVPDEVQPPVRRRGRGRGQSRRGSKKPAAASAVSGSGAVLDAIYQSDSGPSPLSSPVPRRRAGPTSASRGVSRSGKTR